MNRSSLPLLLATLAPTAFAPQTARAAEPPPPAVGVLQANPSRARVALIDLEVDGEETTPALGMSLQDGFVLGLVRAGVPVLDPVDVSRRLAKHPELQHCDSSPCLKNLGQILETRFVMRVKVSVTGNIYKMTARLFSTEGAAPAALPVETQARFCDVCSVAEARDVMIRLADAIKKPLEEAPPPTPPRQRPRPPGASVASILGVVAGVAAIFAGAGVLASLSDSTGKGKPATAGALMGAGLVAATVGLYLTFDRPPVAGEPPGVKISLAWRW